MIAAVTQVFLSRHMVVCEWPRKVCGTQVYYTETANLPFSTSLNSITSGLISIRFAYFMPTIYTTEPYKFQGHEPSSLWNMCSWKLPHILHIFLCTILIKTHDHVSAAKKAVWHTMFYLQEPLTRHFKHLVSL